jgi:ketosteroid isomerase-like protein
MSAARTATTEEPGQLGQLFAERVNARDLDGMLALYENTATFVGLDGVSAAGKREIRVRLEGLLAMAPQITATDSDVVIAHDVALMCNHWTMKLGVLDNDAPSLDGRSTEVARRQSDGSWLYVIDNPTVLSDSETPR